MLSLDLARARGADAPKRGEQTPAVLRHARLLVEKAQHSGRGRVRLDWLLARRSIVVMVVLLRSADMDVSGEK